MPWNELCWFGHGHTLHSELFKNNGFNNVLFVDRGLDSAILPLYEDDNVLYNPNFVLDPLDLGKAEKQRL